MEFLGVLDMLLLLRRFRENSFIRFHSSVKIIIFCIRLITKRMRKRKRLLTLASLAGKYKFKSPTHI